MSFQSQLLEGARMAQLIKDDNETQRLVEEMEMWWPGADFDNLRGTMCKRIEQLMTDAGFDKDPAREGMLDYDDELLFQIMRKNGFRVVN